MDFEIYVRGVVFMSVCVDDDMPIEQIERCANQKSPSGISSEWKISEEPTFSGGEPNPSPCPDKPGHTHYLLSC